MLKPIKISHDNKDIFISSDLHLNQSCDSWENPLWKSRGFYSKEDHFNGVIAKWNSICTDSSVCFLLGDTVFQDPKGEVFREVVKLLKYKKLYILQGNHNSGYKPVYDETLAHWHPDIAAKGLEVYPLEFCTGEKSVFFLPAYAEFLINGKQVACCHYPIVSHNNMRKFSLHLTGHSHDNLPLTSVKQGRGKRLDVGWDGWGRPISFEEIRAFLASRDIDAPDHH